MLCCKELPSQFRNPVFPVFLFYTYTAFTMGRIIGLRPSKLSPLLASLLAPILTRRSHSRLEAEARGNLQPRRPEFIPVRLLGRGHETDPGDQAAETAAEGDEAVELEGQRSRRYVGLICCYPFRPEKPGTESNVAQNRRIRSRKRRTRSRSSTRSMTGP